jgi:AP2 domain.
MKEIHLTRGKVALVDDADWMYLSQWAWCAHRPHQGYEKYYAVRRQVGTKGGLVSMARVILGLTDPKIQAEHKNGDTLDNRRNNLRPATSSQNNANKGLRKDNKYGVRGVTYRAHLAKGWKAQITFGGKAYYIGYFVTMEEAADAYRQKAQELFGDFVRE